MTIHTRPGHKADVSELSHVLGRAFYDDPVSVWIMPDPKARAAHLRFLARQADTGAHPRPQPEVVTRDG